MSAAISGFTRSRQRERPAHVGADDAGRDVDEEVGHLGADRVADRLGDRRVPGRQAAHAGLLLAEVHVHDRGAGVARGRASAAICSGVTGTGCCAGSVSTPVRAQVITAASDMAASFIGDASRCQSLTVVST